MTKKKWLELWPVLASSLLSIGVIISGHAFWAWLCGVVFAVSVIIFFASPALSELKKIVEEIEGWEVKP